MDDPYVKKMIWLETNIDWEPLILFAYSNAVQHCRHSSHVATVDVNVASETFLRNELLWRRILPIGMVLWIFD